MTEHDNTPDPSLEPADDAAAASSLDTSLEPTEAKRRRLTLRGRSGWTWAGAAIVVLLLAGGVAAAAIEIDGGHDRGEGGHDREGRDGSHGKNRGEHDSHSSDDNEAERGNGTGDANGPIVIEPTSPGGDRTVVWPDGRIVVIPGSATVRDDSSTSDGSTVTTSDTQTTVTTD